MLLTKLLARARATYGAIMETNIPIEATMATLTAFFMSILPISPMISEIPKLGIAAAISSTSAKMPARSPVVCRATQPL